MGGGRLRLVILGSVGRVGAALARGFAGEAEVVAFNRRELDLADAAALERVLGPLEFDVVVNCAALTSPDYCQTHPEEAFATNATAVGRLATLCTRKGARCVHLSTDYVFEGREPGLRHEGEPTKPVNIYGESKLAGEEALLAAGSEHLAVRVSWVFGPDRPGFVEQTLARALAGEPLEAVADKWSRPTGVADLQEGLRPLLREVPVGGILHLTQAGEPASWHEYGQAVVDLAVEVGLPVRTRQVRPMRLAEIGFTAPRPVHTAMATARWERLAGRKLRPWREALAEYLRAEAARAPEAAPRG